MTPQGFAVLLRWACAVLAGLYLVLAAAGLGGVAVAALEGAPVGVAVFVLLTGLSAWIAGAAWAAAQDGGERR